MKYATRTKQTIEFGDFQTPKVLAFEICNLLSRLEIKPKTIIEPTCGTGNFLHAALDKFQSSEKVYGVDISKSHLEKAKEQLIGKDKACLIKSDFFQMDWASFLSNTSEPILVIGNPPWVTNSQLSIIESFNVPVKSNFQNFNGYDALTGKSNFDISEWMLIQILNWLNERDAMMAMLCKTSVARKVLNYAWKHHLSLFQSSIYNIDAEKYFGISADACLLVCKLTPSAQSFYCDVFDSLNKAVPSNKIGHSDGEFIASFELYKQWKHLRGNFSYWRSGIKHDCSKVMELIKQNGKYRNGFGELVELEDAFLYPMMKGSNVANGVKNTERFMLVTQKKIGEETYQIKTVAPKTWAYLMRYATLLDERKSSIYKKRPRFSIFGVGDYSFTKWKVAVAGLYKKLDFKVVGSGDCKPIVLDDTVYFIPCESEEQAKQMALLLNSETAKKFFHAFIFWDSKRPITIDVLRKLDLSALARELKDKAFDESTFNLSSQSSFSFV
jgi:SAM-dependent methyltransferase